MNPFASSILTPDQRLRVFVSSTLQELAEERNAVKEAIHDIHLTPVMFEMGARPHAPRNIYRQYLAQSQIFIGIYWDRYGWVAPGETVSGLEDEYNLSGNMPKLIYIKHSEGKRDDTLSQLIRRIQTDDKVSYKSFTNAEELGELVVNDLAVLLTERFNESLRVGGQDHGFILQHSIPAVPNSIIGREQNIEEIIHILNDPSRRLVTLTGPGGIGKTRLAIETAHRLRHTFTDGVVFIPLAPLKDATLVPDTMAYALGIKASGVNSIESVKLFLKDKQMLLVLDNFEQIMGAAPIVEELLLASPELKIIVTSRERLALSFEHLYIVPTLSDTLPYPAPSSAKYPPAIELFIQRAKSVQPSFTVTDQNREVIYTICSRLEGLPLAIELAAGQISMLSPALLLQKLDHRLDALRGNFRDIPDRQKTIRKTIEWSYDLLTAQEQCMLLQMSLYTGGCLLEAVEKMCTEEVGDVYVTLGALIDKSLVMKQEEDGRVRFQMFESVRDFAVEKLIEKDLMVTYKKRMAQYYHKAMDGIKLQKNRINHAEILRYLEREHANIRQVLEFLTERKELKLLTDIAWGLWLFWWVNAHTKEGYTWLKKAWDVYVKDPSRLDHYGFCILAANVGFMAFLQRDIPTFMQTLGRHLDDILRHEDDELVATAALITGVVKTIVKEYDTADQLLHISLDRYKKIQLNTGIGLALSALGRNAIYNGHQTSVAKAYYKQSMDLARKDHNEISVIIALSGFALCEAVEKSANARIYLMEALQMSQRLHFYEAMAWSMEIWSLVSVNENNPLHAVSLMGAVDHLRMMTQMPVWEDLQELILQAKAQIEKELEPAIFAKAWIEGSLMSVDRMVTFAQDNGSHQQSLAA